MSETKMVKLESAAARLELVESGYVKLCRRLAEVEWNVAALHRRIDSLVKALEVKEHG